MDCLNCRGIWHGLFKLHRGVAWLFKLHRGMTWAVSRA